MLDLRLAATALAMLVALVSVSLADAVKDKSPDSADDVGEPVARSSAESRPIRVVLPASWEPSEKQAETQSSKLKSDLAGTCGRQKEQPRPHGGSCRDVSYRAACR